MTINVPDFMPVLSSGKHSDSSEGACVMEYVSFLAGEEWSDSPECVHPMLASAAREVNDLLDDKQRQKLLPLMNRFFNTNSDDSKLNAKLAIFCAKYVQHLNTDPSVADAIKAAEVALADPSDENIRAANVAAYAAAAAATAAAYADHAAAYAAYAVSHAAYDTTQFLSDLLDEYDRLTGRTVEEYTEITEKEYQKMYELTKERV